MTQTTDAPASSTRLTPEDVRDQDKRDGSRYYIHPRTGERLPSVTTILSATDGKPHLVPWSARLAAEYAVDNIAHLVGVTINEGRDAAVKLAKDQAARIRDVKRDAGSYVHAVAESLVLWAASPEGTGAEIILPVLPDELAGAEYDDDPIENVTDWMLTGFTNFFSDWNPKVEAAEMPVFSLRYGVAGTLDLIIILFDVEIGPSGRLVRAPGKILVLCVDIKTGKHLDCTVPEQLAAYRRMDEALILPEGTIIAMPPTDAAAVLHLRPEHEDGYRLMLVGGTDDEKAWGRFLEAIDLHKGRKGAGAKPGKVIYPPRPDGTVPAPRLADLDGEGYGRAITPLMKAGYEDLDQVAALTAAQARDLKGIADKTLDVARKMLADHGLSFADETPEIAKAA
jgi:hypothetical protein